MELTIPQIRTLDSWHHDICGRATLIDADDKHDWFSLWVGFAIASGLSVEEATNYDFYFRHAFPLEGL